MGGSKGVRLLILVIVGVMLGATSVGASGPNSDNGTTVSLGAAEGTISDTGRADPWATLPPNPEGVSRPAGAFVNDHFLVIGGQSTGGFLGYVQEYDPVAGTWDNSNATMPVPLSNTCAAAIGSDV